MRKFNIDKIKIEKNVPIPLPPPRPPKNTFKALAEKMDINDSVELHAFKQVKSLETAIKNAGYFCLTLKIEDPKWPYHVSWRVWKKNKKLKINKNKKVKT